MTNNFSFSAFAAFILLLPFDSLVHIDSNDVDIDVELSFAIDDSLRYSL